VSGTIPSNNALRLMIDVAVHVPIDAAS
jgi:hypothetical protein